MFIVPFLISLDICSFIFRYPRHLNLFIDEIANQKLPLQCHSRRMTQLPQSSRIWPQKSQILSRQTQQGPQMIQVRQVALVTALGPKSLLAKVCFLVIINVFGFLF